MDTGLNTEALERFRAHKVLRSEDLLSVESRERLITRVVSDNYPHNYATVCAGGGVRSPKFAQLLMNTGVTVLTPSGSHYRRIIQHIDSMGLIHKPTGVIFPTISQSPINTLICHAELGTHEESESWSVNKLLLKIGKVIKEKKINLNIKIINGNENNYLHL